MGHRSTLVLNPYEMYHCVFGICNPEVFSVYLRGSVEMTIIICLWIATLVNKHIVEQMELFGFIFRG